MLISRPAGRDAYFSAKSYLFGKKVDLVVFDFAKVKVLTPSFLDEFVNLLKSDYPDVKIIFGKSDNQSVIASLKILKL